MGVCILSLEYKKEVTLSFAQLTRTPGKKKKSRATEDRASLNKTGFVLVVITQYSFKIIRIKKDRKKFKNNNKKKN
jgi:hypothetical protein